MSLLAAVIAALAAAPFASAAPQQPAGAGRGGPVVIASKPFAESYLLAEIFAQLLEARGIAVVRRPGLGATEIAFGALRTGAIDVYPEYTGTGLIAILDAEPGRSARATFDTVARAFRERWGVRWLAPLGFENTYAIAIRRATADSLRLRTLSDLAAVAPRLIAGFSPDFIGREDGLPGLEREYGLDFGDLRALLQAVKYEALANRAVDVIDGYSTDARIDRYGLVVLEDDLGFFPPYEAAALVGRRIASERADVIAALAELSGRIDVERMRALNRRVELDSVPIDRVATAALMELGLLAGSAGDARSAGSERVGAGAGRTGPDRGTRTGLIRYFWTRRSDLLPMMLRHLLLVGGSLLAAVAAAVPLGLVLERRRRHAETAIRVAGVLQVIPGIALLAFMIPVLGIGVPPALVALFLYSLYPILRNTFTGVRDAGPDAVRAAHALGMTEAQILRYVRLPLAAPIIMAGIRTAAVINVGTATLAAFIGAGGLGDPIVAGLALSDTRMILLGAIPAAILALAADAVLAGVERRLRPRGL